MKLQSVQGKVFGRLTVVKQAASDKRGRNWLCKCQCGTKKVVCTSDLNSGNVASCGCALKENSGVTKHGMTHLPEYHVWHDMIRRCTNSNVKNYKNYGGRGIRVCQRWLESFENFYKDMGAKPGKGYELDREQNDKGYSKQNCRWVTKRENNNNKQNTLYVEHDGERRSLANWAREIGVSYDRLNSAYRRGHARQLIANLTKEKF